MIGILIKKGSEHVMPQLHNIRVWVAFLGKWAEGGVLTGGRVLGRTASGQKVRCLQRRFGLLTVHSQHGCHLALKDGTLTHICAAFRPAI